MESSLLFILERGLGIVLQAMQEKKARHLVRKSTLARQLEETHETLRSSRDEALIFLHGLETNHESSLQTEEEAGLP